jgi:hypothetical protein
MIAELRVARLLDGYRGGTVASRRQLAELVARVSALAGDLPEIAELDLNPVICGGDGIVAVDARIRVAAAVEAPDPVARQLAG